jgi:pimeloyl-ACP methyl ester carboxylesterase
MEYEPLLREMCRDRRVIAFDTPGYGMSDRPPQPLTASAYAAAFADAIDVLQLQTPVDVFGFHTGALLALELGLARPEAVARLALCGIPMRSAEERAARLQAVRAMPPPSADGIHSLATSQKLWQFVVTERSAGVPLERAIDIFAEKNRTLHRGWWAYEGVWSYDYSKLAQVTQPTVVMQPDDSLLESSRSAAALIPHAKFIALPDLERDVLELAVPLIATELRRFLTADPNAAKEKIS